MQIEKANAERSNVVNILSRIVFYAKVRDAISHSFKFLCKARCSQPTLCKAKGVSICTKVVRMNMRNVDVCVGRREEGRSEERWMACPGLNNQRGETMNPEDIEAIEARYQEACEANENGYSGYEEVLIESMNDVPSLLAEVERLNKVLAGYRKKNLGEKLADEIFKVDKL